ncbi:MAG: Gfo/Idh/MocA family oxidoreductase [bacterium]|nr:Gfo/Idh/MocA family oxidoreductase [bacterium]
MEFRIGIIGAGAHGERYLRHGLRDVPGMTVTAVCRRDRRAGAKLAAHYAVRYLPEAPDVVAAPDVDGVVVCTPPSSHGGLAASVMAAGKPLLLEKPMTGTLGEAEHLAALDTGAAAPLFLGQSLRWNPVILKARELWPRLGRVHLVRLAQRLAPTTLPWQRDPAQTVGGSVLLTGVHLFDLARFLTGREFARVDSRHWQVAHPVVEDFFLARAELDDGCQVSLEVSKYTDSRAQWLEAVGEHGQLWADYLTGGLVLRQGRSAERFDVDATVPTLPAMLRDWLACVTAGARPPVGALDGLATLRVVDACYRSAAAGAAVSLDA